MGSILVHPAVFQQKTANRTNWSGNYRYRAHRLHQPNSIDELRDLVKSCSKVKALGARHSFNGIADTAGDQISLVNFDGIAIHAESNTVTVGAGVTYGHLAPYLQSSGYALHNLASLPHISIVGACATATHGSGSKNGNLTTAVTSMELVTADGEIKVLSRQQNQDLFEAAAVNLGALGIVTAITLRIEPTFDVQQVLYENLPFSALEHTLDYVFASAHSVSLFTDWQNSTVTQVWLKSRIDPGRPASFEPAFHGATLATRKLHPLAGHPAENCTEQLGIPGPWHERLPHFRMNFTPSSGDELQSEYFVPREKGYQAIMALDRLRHHIAPHLIVSEFRTIEADKFWMSPCYQQPIMAMHFTWKPDLPALRSLLPLMEEQLAPFNAKPHWAKLFTTPPARLRSLYPKFTAFEQLLNDYDPAGKFRNDFLTDTFFRR